jgi:hypothetical protein
MQDHTPPLAGGNEPAGFSIHSGFPNPAADNLDRPSPLALDLNQLLIHHPSSTYLFRVSGDQWSEQGIFDGDIAIVDRALQAGTYSIVLSWRDEEFILSRRSDLLKNQHIWGAVSAIIHPCSQGVL